MPIQAPQGTTIVSAAGLNNSGQITGQTADGQAFIASTSSFFLVPLPSGASQAQGLAINNLGQITGSARPPGAAFVGSAAGSTLLPLPPGVIGTVGIGINDSGLVVGSAGGNRVFVGTTAGSSLVLPPLQLQILEAFKVNNAGQIVEIGVNAVGSLQFLISSNGAFEPIPFPSGFGLPLTASINSAGEVVGLAGAPVTQAFVASTAGASAISLPMGAFIDYSQPGAGFIGINDSGAVIGQSNMGPWIWEPREGTRLLNGLLPKGWSLSYVFGINNLGEIGAYGTFDGVGSFVILSPIGNARPVRRKN